MQDFPQTVYSQLLISKYNHFFAQSKINLQKNFLATLWADSGLILAVERPPGSKNSVKHRSKIVIQVVSAEIGYQRYYLSVCSAVAMQLTVALFTYGQQIIIIIRFSQSSQTSIVSKAISVVYIHCWLNYISLLAQLTERIIHQFYQSQLLPLGTLIYILSVFSVYKAVLLLRCFS